MTEAARFRNRFMLPLDSKKLGSGCFASVTKAFDLTLRRDVALKVISKTGGSKEAEAHREAAIMMKLDHPHIVKCDGLFEDKQNWYLPMELLQGQNLWEFLIYNELGERTVREWFSQLTYALSHMHERGFVHRDIKLDNVMVDEKRNFVTLIDFGFAEAVDSFSCSRRGSTFFVAPEILKTKTGSKSLQLWATKSDVWSLGVLLYVMLSNGEVYPFGNSCEESAEFEIYDEIKRKPLELQESFPPAAADLLVKMLQKNPDDRCHMDEVMSHPYCVQGYNKLFLKSRSLRKARRTSSAPRVPLLNLTKALKGGVGSVDDMISPSPRRLTQMALEKGIKLSSRTPRIMSKRTALDAAA